MLTARMQCSVQVTEGAAGQYKHNRPCAAHNSNYFSDACVHHAGSNAAAPYDSPCCLGRTVKFGILSYDRSSFRHRNSRST